MVGFIACVALVFSILCFNKIHTLKKDKTKEDRGKSRETEAVPDILDQGCKRDYSVKKQFKTVALCSCFSFFNKTMLTDDICRGTI